jgi:hypothetical protein
MAGVLCGCKFFVQKKNVILGLLRWFFCIDLFQLKCGWKSGAATVIISARLAIKREVWGTGPCPNCIFAAGHSPPLLV